MNESTKQAIIQRAKEAVASGDFYIAMIRMAEQMSENARLMERWKKIHTDTEIETEE